MLGVAAIRRRPPRLSFTSGTFPVETGSSTQMLKAIVRAGLLVALVMGVSAAAARADVVDDIKERGTLIVGSKADYKPYGFLDPSGKIVGLEPDLAADVAKKLGVKLELEIGRAHV